MRANPRGRVRMHLYRGVFGDNAGRLKPRPGNSVKWPLAVKWHLRKVASPLRNIDPQPRPTDKVPYAPSHGSAAASYPASAPTWSFSGARYDDLRRRHRGFGELITQRPSDMRRGLA